MYAQTTIDGEDFVGLLGLATDRYAILAKKFKDMDVLGVPVIKTTVYGTNLIGLFAAGNSNGLLLPHFTAKGEVERIKKKIKDAGIDLNIATVDENCTAIGNLVCANDNAAVISPKFYKKKVFEDTLGVEVIQRKIANHEEVGSCTVATNKGFIVHPKAEQELDELAEIFKVEGKIGTANFGFPYMGAGLIANSNGYITGTRTSGIELGKIDDALGFID